jgi:TRAP-type C4-dicarboxylate transport system permease small subunit
MFRLYDRLLDRVTALVRAVVILMATAIFAIVLLTVVTRYLLGFVFSWSEEVPRYLLVWIALLGTALALDQDEHIGFDGIFLRLPPLAQRLLRPVLALGIAFVALVMVYYGIAFVRQFGDDLMESIPLRNVWLYSAMPVAGALTLLYLVRREGRRLRGLPPAAASAPPDER